MGSQGNHQRFVRAGILAVLLGLCALSAIADDDPREVRRQVVLEAVLGDKVMLSIDGQRQVRRATSRNQTND